MLNGVIARLNYNRHGDSTSILSHEAWSHRASRCNLCQLYQAQSIKAQQLVSINLCGLGTSSKTLTS